MTVSWVSWDAIPAESTVRCWLPEAPERKLGGAWHLVDGAAGILELASSFPPRIVGGDVHSSYDVVHLETANVSGATLIDCREIGSIGRGGGGRDNRAQTLEVGTAMWGACLKQEDLRFSEALFTTAGLAEWAFPDASSRFETTVEESGTRAEYRRPPAFDGQVRGTRVQLLADVNPLERGPSVTFDEEVMFRVSWDGAQPWDTVIRPTCLRLADLLSFATRRPNPPAAMRVAGPALALQHGDMHITESVAVFDATIRPSAESFDSTRRVLFHLGQAPGGWEGLANAWMDLQDEIGISLDLLTTLRTSAHETLYSRFFAAAQMLEGYHRARIGGQRMEAAVCLAHGNEPSFRERIDAVLQRAGQLGRGVARLRPQFSRDVVKYRNDYAHLLRPHDVPAELELIDLVVASEWIMIGCVLQDLVWGDAEAWALVGNHPAYGSATRPLVPIKARPGRDASRDQ